MARDAVALDPTQVSTSAHDGIGKRLTRRERVRFGAEPRIVNSRGSLPSVITHTTAIRPRMQTVSSTITAKPSKGGDAKLPACWCSREGASMVAGLPNATCRGTVAGWSPVPSCRVRTQLRSNATNEAPVAVFSPDILPITLAWIAQNTQARTSIRGTNSAWLRSEQDRTQGVRAAPASNRSSRKDSIWGDGSKHQWAIR